MHDMRERGPKYSYVSNRAEADVAKCILFKWQDTYLAGGAVQAYLQPNRLGGTTVHTHGNEYFFDVKAVRNKAEITYYAVADNWFSRKLLQSAKGCLR